MIPELEAVALTEDIVQYGLKAGDMGTIVHVVPEEGYVVEFVTHSGHTVALLDLEPHQVRRLDSQDIKSVRRYETY